MTKFGHIIGRYLVPTGGALVILSVYALSGNLPAAIFGFLAGVGGTTMITKFLNI